jgi:hypothetical protein
LRFCRGRFWCETGVAMRENSMTESNFVVIALTVAA